MNTHFRFGLAIATVLLAGCSAAEGDVTANDSDPNVGTTSAALSVGSYNCATLTVASFGTSTDLYNPTNASSPATLYAFLNAALAQSTEDVAHAGSHDYSNEAHQSLQALQSAQSELQTLLTWLTTNDLSGTNASASAGIASSMNAMISDFALAAYLESISAIGNYPPSSGANAASYVELYSRKALEIANQAGAHGDYCYVSPYGRQIPNEASFPNMTCSSVP